jgi:hypothetical protein
VKIVKKFVFAKEKLFYLMGKLAGGHLPEAFALIFILKIENFEG